MHRMVESGQSWIEPVSILKKTMHEFAMLNAILLNFFSSFKIYDKFLYSNILKLVTLVKLLLLSFYNITLFRF